MEWYADARKNATPRDLKIGDTALVEKRQGKLAPFFKVESHIVTSKNGNMITAKARDKQITHHVSRRPPSLAHKGRNDQQNQMKDLPTIIINSQEVILC